MEKEKPQKAVGYIRVSTAMQASEGESLTTQRNQIQEFVKGKGWALEKVYADEGISGAKIENRTQFQQMIEDAKQNKFDVIVFSKLSRFARNAREYLNISYELEKHSVLIASIKENIDPTTKTGKMIAGILALFAEWEHETIKEQMQENKVAKWKERRCFIGQPPFGYIYNKEKGKLEVNEREAKIYKRIVNMYVDKGMSYKDIQIQLNKEGVKCKRKPFSSATLGYLLKNPAYYGNYVLNKVKYENTRRTKDSKDASEFITFEIPALISKKRWDEIQETLQFRKVKSKRSDASEHFILRDICICGECGGKVKPVTSMSQKEYYTCYWRRTSKKNLAAQNRERCSLNYLNKEALENQVWSDVLVKFALNPDKTFGKMFTPEKHEQKKETLKDAITHCESELKKQQNVKDNLYKLLELPDTDINELHQKLNEVNNKLISLESDKKEHQEKLNGLTDLQTKETEIKSFIQENKNELKNLRKQIRNLSNVDKKRLIEKMLQGNIVVNDQPDNEQDGKGGPQADYQLTFNVEILHQLADEGKIKFNKNSGHYFKLIKTI